MGAMARIADHLKMGSVKAGTRTHCGRQRPARKSTSAQRLRRQSEVAPRAAPKQHGQHAEDQRPCRAGRREKRMVASRVKTATPQWAAAMSSAALASEMPMTMATEPVMMGGSTLSSASLPDPANEQTGDDRDQRGGDDAALRHPHAAPLGAHDGDHSGDVAKARAIVERDAHPRSQQGDDGGQAAGKERDADIKAGQDGHQHGGREHGQHVLQAKGDHRRKRRTVLG